MRACTAAVVELAYRGAAAAPGDGASQCFDGAAPPRPYGCVVEMATAEFWAEEVGPYKAWLDAATRSSAAPPDGHAARAAYDRVVALFGADALADAAAVYASKRGPGKGAKRRGAYFFEAHASVGATVTLEAATAPELRAAAERYVDSSASAAEGALWPLVRRVAIAGPWASLACGLVLVDAPGLRDDNSARDGVVKQCLARADALLLVSNVRRAVNDKTVKDCLVAPFRARLARDRRPGDVVFVATQTDTMNRGEVAENLGLAEDAPLEAVATARNDFCREAVDAAFYEGLDAAALPANRGAGGFEFAVLACSAVDCQKLEGARTQDGPPKIWDDARKTQVPALRRLLRGAALRPPRDETTGAIFLAELAAAKARAAGAAADAAPPPAAAPTALKTRWDAARAVPRTPAPRRRGAPQPAPVAPFGGAPAPTFGNTAAFGGIGGLFGAPAPAAPSPRAPRAPIPEDDVIDLT